MGIIREKNTLLLPNSVRLPLLNSEPDKMLESRVTHMKGSKQMTTVFDRDTGVVVFNCRISYSTECKIYKKSRH